MVDINVGGFASFSDYNRPADGTYQLPPGTRLASMREAGLLRIEGPRWRLTDPAGLALSNGVLRELLAWWQEQQEGLELAGARSQPSCAAPPAPGPGLAAAVD